MGAPDGAGERRSRSDGVVTPAVLWRAAHGLAMFGEHVELIEIRRGRVALCPVVFHDIDGNGADPDAWLYRVDVSTPDSQREGWVRGAGLLHFRLPGRELWRGEHVLARSTETRALAVALERHLADECSTPSKVIVPQPEGTDQDTRDTLRSEIMRRRTRVLLPATTTASQGDGRALAPITDWKAQRVRAEPTQELVALRENLREQVLHAYGVPPSVTANTPSGLRDADRLIRQTVEAVSRIIAGELTAKLEKSYDLHWPLSPADLTMAVRAYGGLTDAKLDGAQARRICGLR